MIYSGMKSSDSLRAEQAVRVAENDYNAKSKHAEWLVPVRVDSRPLVAAAKATGAPVNPITANRSKYKGLHTEAHIWGNGNASVDAVRQGMEDLERIRKGEQVGAQGV